MEQSHRLIETKHGYAFDSKFALFIDCNCHETSRPVGGPRVVGANAARWLPEVQESFYNRWKSIHGLKHMTKDIFGPTSLRKTSLHYLGNLI
jgi:hypothetical protein